MNSDAGDAVLLEIFRVLKCNFEGELKSVRDVPSAALYEVCVRGLRTISPDVLLNTTMPRSNASKITALEHVVRALVAAGYRGDLSYSALMYPNEGDTRALLLWLNQNIKTVAEVTSGSAGQQLKSGQEVLRSTIALELKRLSTQPWAPSFFPRSAAATLATQRPLGTVPLGSMSGTQPAQVAYVARHQPYACDQSPAHPLWVAPSLLEAHTVALCRQREAAQDKQSGANVEQRRARTAAAIAGHLRVGLGEEAPDALLLGKRLQARRLAGLASRFTRQRNQIDRVEVAKVKTATTEEDLKEARERELLELEEELKRLTAEIAAARSALADLVAGKRQLDAEAAGVARQKQELDKEAAETEMLRRLMEDPEGNRVKLVAITEANASKLYEAGKLWEPRRLQLLAAFRAEQEKYADRRQASAARLREVEGMREKAKDLAAEAQEKDQLYRQLLEQWKALEKGKLRSTHTDKILEGLNNVKKQNRDIDKVLLDTRDLMKEINQITDTLGRSFAIVDELIYRDAAGKDGEKGDEAAKTAYKLLVAMNEKFNDLTNSMRDTVATRNEILELERKITAVKLRTDTLDLKQVRADLDALKAENAELSLRVAQLPEPPKQ